MPKQKTHKGLAKVLNKRKSGTITTNKVGALHKTGKKSGNFNRNKRKKNILSSADRKRLRDLIN
jgi:large subunit ribosomal protein L35